MCRPSDETLYVVDRAEGPGYVLVGPDGAEWLADDLPAGVREGDVVTRREGRWALCPEETRRRRERLEEKKRRLFRRSRGPERR